MKTIFLLFFLFFACNKSAFAYQGSTADSSKIAKAMVDFEQGFDIKTMPSSSGGNVDAERLLSEYKSAYVQYQINILKRNDETFGWQHTASIFIFVISVVITIFGLVFSAIHFKMTMDNIGSFHVSESDNVVDDIEKVTKKGSENTNGNNDVENKVGAKDATIQKKPTIKAKLPNGLETTIELSSTGFKVTSSILGVIILIISLLFFFMYVKFVYPINKI